MYKILRIICCVISALLLAGCVFFFVYLGNVWGFASLIGAGGFFALTVLFKTLQEEKQQKDALNGNAAPGQLVEQPGEQMTGQTPENSEEQSGEQPKKPVTPSAGETENGE